MSEFIIEAVVLRCKSCGGNLDGNTCERCGSSHDLVSRTTSGEETPVLLEDALIAAQVVIKKVHASAKSDVYPYLEYSEKERQYGALQESHEMRNKLLNFSVIIAGILGTIGSTGFLIANVNSEWTKNQEAVTAVVCFVVALISLLTITGVLSDNDFFPELLFRDQNKVQINEETNEKLQTESFSKAARRMNQQDLMRMFEFWQRFNKVLGDQPPDLVLDVAKILNVNIDQLVAYGQIQNIAAMKAWCEATLAK